MQTFFANAEYFFTIGRDVVLDSGFCVLRGMVELKMDGILAGVLIKKQQYWLVLVLEYYLTNTLTAKRVVRYMGWVFGA